MMKRKWPAREGEKPVRASDDCAFERHNTDAGWPDLLVVTLDQRLAVSRAFDGTFS
jgi:hypothetical protein